MLLSIFSFAPLLALVAAQGGYTTGGGGGYGQSSTAASSTTAAPGASSSTASSGSAVHSVAVGMGGLSFTPSTISAKVGDQVEFTFVSSGHSVAAGSFGKPCAPAEGGFFSGTVSPGGQPWTITVNNTNPLFFYCATSGHCQAGMVGVINPYVMYRTASHTFIS
jgi:plastocyanin